MSSRTVYVLAPTAAASGQLRKLLRKARYTVVELAPNDEVAGFGTTRATDGVFLVDLRNRRRAPDFIKRVQRIRRASRGTAVVAAVGAKRSTLARDALKAGATDYLVVPTEADPALLRHRIDAAIGAQGSGESGGEPLASSDPVESAARGAPIVASTFELPAPELLDPESGRLDAARVADALGMSLRRLAGAIGVGYAGLHKTPDAPAVQARLAPYRELLAILGEVFDNDRAKILAWLQVSRTEFGGRSAIETIEAEPGIGINAVVTVVSGAWLGEPA